MFMWWMNESNVGVEASLIICLMKVATLQTNFCCAKLFFLIYKYCYSHCINYFVVFTVYQLNRVYQLAASCKVFALFSYLV